MGCISSKVMARSASYRQEMKWGSSRGTARGTQALPGDVLIPKKGSHHFLALVCTATTMADGHRSGSFMYESSISADKTGDDDDDATIVPPRVPLVNQDQSTYDHEASADHLKRSRSWHSFPLEDLPYASSTESCKADNCTVEVNDKGAIRSRSFHTVEDYDRLLKRIWHATLSGKEDGAEESKEEREKEKLTSSTDTANQPEADNADSRETKSSQGGASLVGESNASNVVTIKIASDDKEDLRSVEVNIQSELSEDTAQERHLPLTEKGFKRKSIARELNTLKIPSTFKLPAVASLREWLPEGQVFSQDVDPTPKFGSYFVPSSNLTNKSDQQAIFNDELVFALEEQLQHLKAEEDDILKQITSTWEVPGSTGMKEDIVIS